MRLWISAVLVLFVFVQFYQWVKGFILPLPIYVLAGAFLAIASNYDQGMAKIIVASGKQSLTPSDHHTEETSPQ
ncbi:hypothetical protein cce_3384 [Crocosphaera subtropica ATCC 51142]|uniref:Uncharacterized protein n=1 Tax=Crocosphaera subtropica (strain ATCC 51142 / BH68) TaxID=43989 RepID=B1WYW8_CROS5|nr:hypothetical protein [Crocosphaera subtropica]ACB52732.1 hypothetical protein cce_3384 [Crocosphaera subtropica ATCC 51142]